MDKIDFKKTLKHLYGPSKKTFSVVDVPTMQFLMIDGHGDPNVALEYKAAIEALYAVAYKIKFLSKNREILDYVVPPLEGLWWAEDMGAFDGDPDKSAWDWTMMIMQPPSLTAALFEEALTEVKKKKFLPALSKLRLESYAEGPSVQIQYIGAYRDEGPTIARLHDFALESGYTLCGKHHEIYLSDARRVAPEKLKTVIRQPVCRAADPDA